MSSTSISEDSKVRVGYRDKVHQLVRTLDPSLWKEAHKWMRTEAESMDANDNLYVLLRLSTWKNARN